MDGTRTILRQSLHQAQCQFLQFDDENHITAQSMEYI